LHNLIIHQAYGIEELVTYNGGMEKYKIPALKPVVVIALAFTALTSCDNNLTDSSDVRCDGIPVEADLENGKKVTFIVKGDNGYSAEIQLLPDNQNVIVGVSDDEESPPVEPENYVFRDSFMPISIDEKNIEMSTYAAGGLWNIDIENDKVAVYGYCD
jgi:hypothetical protein